jgi:phosphatidylethanolamine-binding protein (PEBP) family uncharacterized protein
MKKLILVAAIGLAASGTGALAQSKFGASLRWCGSSPEFKLSGVPKGTAKLEFNMVDLNVPGYRHGGGTMPYQAGQNTIECSAVSAASLGGYNGPSPPPGQVHTYQWTVKALDANSGVLGQAVTQRKFPE